MTSPLTPAERDELELDRAEMVLESAFGPMEHLAERVQNGDEGRT